MKMLGFRFGLAVFLLSFILPLSHANSAELLMFDSPVCDWCELWEEEIGVIYEKTAEAKTAPLRRQSIYDDLPDDLGFLRRVHFTPTFVLIDKGKEVGRINGYPGEENFWFLLEQLIGKLDKNLSACPSGKMEGDAKC